MPKKNLYKDAEILWKDRKRFMGMPLSFTRYRIIKKPGKWIKLIGDVGFLHSEVEEINLFRIEDIKVYQSFANKFWGVGTLTIYSKDRSTPEYSVIKIKDPYKVRSLITELLEEDRSTRNMVVSEAHI